jgi:hypothetical protein
MHGIALVLICVEQPKEYFQIFTFRPSSIIVLLHKPLCISRDFPLLSM